MSCSFGGRRVALIVSDGRIVIREKAVKDDIASFPPCGALSISLNDTGDFVAVGNESGVVLVWNVLTHQQEILSTSVSSPVTAVTFIDSTLYSVQSGKLYQWDQKTGQVAETFKLEKKSKITRMTRGINNCILVAGRKIKAISLKTGEAETNFDGHTTECSALVANSKLLVSAGGDEKSASVYTVQNGNIECRLQLTRSAKHMDLNGRHVLVLNNESDGSGNQVDLFTAPATAKANKMIKAKKSLNISDEHGDQVEIFGVRFLDSDEKSTKCDVVYGVPAALEWEEIDITGQINIERNVVNRKVTQGNGMKPLLLQICHIEVDKNKPKDSF